jgi:hypothetical protein
MLPRAYMLPAGILFVLGGTLACFAGHRLFRVVLGIYGFIFGAMLASSVMGVSNSVGMIVAAIAGGVAGALILVFAYFVGIALVGAGVGALIAHLAWTWMESGDPPAVAIVIASISGALGATLVQRYLVIVATAFGGAWTIVVGALTVASARSGVRGRAAEAPWILYPFTPVENRQWVVVAWIALGLIGTFVQLALERRK